MRLEVVLVQHLHRQVGAGKIARLVNLAAYTEVMVAVDDAANVADLDAAAQAKGVPSKETLARLGL